MKSNYKSIDYTRKGTIGFYFYKWQYKRVKEKGKKSIKSDTFIDGGDKKVHKDSAVIYDKSKIV